MIHDAHLDADKTKRAIGTVLDADDPADHREPPLPCRDRRSAIAGLSPPGPTCAGFRAWCESRSGAARRADGRFPAYLGELD
ncbi:MAG: hypothetical protein JW751_04785 [Polyangiaceae bacterium]|nr:hypothetical protein [Polyangiaceae bacterium]